METNNPQQANFPNHPWGAPRKDYGFIAKVLILGLISVGLLIPLFMTSGLVTERQNYAEGAVNEVSTKWGGEQVILSPIIAVPYTTVRKEGRDSIYDQKHMYFLPAKLDAKAQVDVETRKRGIYKVPVYNTEATLAGEWNLATFTENLSPELIQALRFHEAKIMLGVSDLKGFKSHAKVIVDGTSYTLRPVNEKSIDYEVQTDDIYGYTEDRSLKVLVADRPMQLIPEGTISFSTQLSFSGSQQLSIATIGSSTSIDMTSNWSDPSFGGYFLPESSEIGKDGFTAHWQTVDYNRGYDNVLSEEELPTAIQNSPGVKFQQLVSEYTQTDRSIKYGILIILLSFVSIFFIELSLRKLNVNVNVFHYLLVGLALVLFYTLLLSMSEFIGFGWAYLVASVMTIGLVGLFFRSILPPGKHSLILVGILFFLYLLIYLLIQTTTYTLLIGSFGLFFILAMVMYVSKKLIK